MSATTKTRKPATCRIAPQIKRALPQMDARMAAMNDQEFAVAAEQAMRDLGF